MCTFLLFDPHVVGWKGISQSNASFEVFPTMMLEQNHKGQNVDMAHVA